MVCWISQCTHRHECSIDRFLNLSTILWHAALSLHHCHRLYQLVVNNDGEKHVFSIKTEYTTNSLREQVSSGIATGHQLIAWIASDILISQLLCFIPNKNCTSHQTILVNASHQTILVNAGLRQSKRARNLTYSTCFLFVIWYVTHQ